MATARIARTSFDAEGCATARAAAAAAAELAEGASVLDAALIGPDEIAEALGGVGPQGAHAVELAADALGRALAGLAGSELELAPAPVAGERVLVALSGGVDSAVAALRERERGAEVVAVTLKLWADRRTDAERSCCSPVAVLGARRLAQGLGIPHLTLDLEPRFREQVVGAFVDGYRAGRTPNPCIVCNGELRIDAMLALAERLGCAALATGHYARIADDGEGPLLRAGADPAKDQSYMLSGLAPESLARLRFPLAELSKPRVRELAAGAGLAVADKAESQDLCFLAGEGKRSFLARHGGLDERPGEIVDRAGRPVGRHRGHHGFTVGQRRGLGGRRTRAALRARHRRRDEHRRRGLARGARHPPGDRAPGDPAPARRAGRPGAAALPLAPARLHGRAGRAGGPSAARARARRARVRRRPGPDRMPALRRRRRRQGDDRLSRCRRAAYLDWLPR